VPPPPAMHAAGPALSEGAEGALVGVPHT